MKHWMKVRQDQNNASYKLPPLANDQKYLYLYDQVGGAQVTRRSALLFLLLLVFLLHAVFYFILWAFYWLMFPLTSRLYRHLLVWASLAIVCRLTIWLEVEIKKKKQINNRKAVLNLSCVCVDKA